MKKNLTELVFILDRSGSMQGLEGDTIGGFNAMLEKQKEEPGEAFVSTVLFDVQRGAPRPPGNGPRSAHHRKGVLRPRLHRPAGRGGRGYPPHRQHSQVCPVEDVPEHTLFVITTDGMENASRRYTAGRVKAMIHRQTEQYGWEFLFLGPTSTRWRRRATWASPPTER